MYHYTFIDKLIMKVESLKPKYNDAKLRATPANGLDETDLSADEKTIAAGKMRVNHTGEVCAQALYIGQAITARDPEVKQTMQKAAVEEIDHLNWCKQRLSELDSRPSLLNPIWFVGSLTIGTVAGIAGDKWSLGFLEETEKQVTEHLNGHINSWPEHDKRSLAILEQMKVDEQKHATTANNCGAAKLPQPIPYLMTITAKVMTTIANKL